MRPCHGRDRGFESRRFRQSSFPFPNVGVAELADAYV